jgi:DNA-binding response OmpR family regulator
MKVLVAEDDENIRRGLVEILRDEGYTTTAVADGEAALEAFARERPDFVCLDIMMPKINGYDVCRQIRRQSPDVPIMFISAKSEEVDRVLGLELGGDDYILKPFGVREVVARIRAITRRCRAASGGAGDAPFIMGDLEVLPGELRARRGDQTIELSLRDVRILALLHRERGKALERDRFFKECWGIDHIANSRTLDQHVSQLRKRIEIDPRDPQIIRTVHGVGYRFDG